MIIINLNQGVEFLVVHEAAAQYENTNRKLEFSGNRENERSLSSSYYSLIKIIE